MNILKPGEIAPNVKYYHQDIWIIFYGTLLHINSRNSDTIFTLFSVGVLLGSAGVCPWRVRSLYSVGKKI